MKRLSFGLLLLSAIIATRSVAAPTNAPGQTADPLAPPVRRAIALRMKNHGADLNALLSAVIILDHQAVENRARSIGETPMLPRPAPSEINTLNAAVPERYFSFQDQFAKQAKALADAAHRRDDAKMAHAFSQLTETCVGCHSAFMWRVASSGE